MNQNVKLFFCSMIVTVTSLTALLLMPFAEYNSSRYLSGDPPKMAEFSFDEEALTVGVFGEKLTLESEKIDKTAEKMKPLAYLLPNELRVSAKILEILSEYIGEAE